MKTILIFQDKWAVSPQAIKIAKTLAQTKGYELLLWNKQAIKKEPAGNLVLAGNILSYYEEITQLKNEHEFVGIREIKIDEQNIYQTFNNNNVQMIISCYNGMMANVPSLTWPILSKINCPLMLIPCSYRNSEISHIVYLNDLRYCKKETLRFLGGLIPEKRGRVTLAHIPASGIPDLEEHYGQNLYHDTIKLHDNGQFYYCPIKERNVNKAAEVLTSIMNADALAMAYRRFHFYSLINDENTLNGVQRLQVPLLLFPR